MNGTNIQDVLEAISDFSQAADQRFGDLEAGLTKNDEDIESIGTLLNRIESQMVTKDYLNEKHADLRGDLAVLLRKEDNKLGALITELISANVLPEDAAMRVL
ncbi:MAG: hypothetical protein O3B64_01990 [bacterium]|nr:hypothetical protein [bacterium]